jgi:hypothetical protein
VLARSPAGVPVRAARIPRTLQTSLDSSYPAVRIGAVDTLAGWLAGADPGRVLTAYRTLHGIAGTDAPAVAAAARAHLHASGLTAGTGGRSRTNSRACPQSGMAAGRPQEQRGTDVQHAWQHHSRD